MQLKPEQERVSSLLKETITLMCKNGLKFETKFTIDAVIGVTLDEKEVFLISVNEMFSTERSITDDHENGSNMSDGEVMSTGRRKRRRRDRRVKRESGSDGESGPEPERDDGDEKPDEARNHDSNDDNSIMFIKEEPEASSWQTVPAPCSFQDQNNAEQSEVNFSAFPSADVSHDATDLNFGDAPFTSGVSQPLIARSGPRQHTSASYLPTSANHTALSQIGGNQTQGQNQSLLEESCWGVPAGHYPRPIPSTPAREKPTKRCRVCYTKGRRKEVRNYCVGCEAQPGLCLGECFRIFHMGPLPSRRTSMW